MHPHASSWRVAAVRSCGAGLVDHAECPEKVSVCKRTVASRFQYLRVEVRLCEEVDQNEFVI